MNLLRDTRLRNRAIALGASALLLAVVIFVITAVSGPQPSARRTSADPSVRTQQMLSEAREAVSRGETATAATIAEKILERDPSNRTARNIVDEIEDAAAEASQPATPSAGTYDRVVSSVGLLLPKKYRDWSPGQTMGDEKRALTTFEPPAASSAANQLVRVALYATDTGSSAKASKFLSNVDKRAYPKSAATVVVGSVTGGYFGTDGTRVAVVAFPRGRYVFEVVVSAMPGVKPVTLKAIAVDVAAAMPPAR